MRGFQLMVNASELLVPPLEHPTSLDPPAGVCTATLTVPGPVISPEVSFTVSFCALVTFAANVLPLMSTTVDDTN